MLRFFKSGRYDTAGIVALVLLHMSVVTIVLVCASIATGGGK